MSIELLRASLLAQLNRHEPIDVKRIDQYLLMRRQEYEQAKAIQAERLEEMKQRTRELTGKITFTDDQIKLNMESIEKIHSEFDLYEAAAVRWVQSEVCPWIDSEAYQIAAGILLLVNEIC